MKKAGIKTITAFLLSVIIALSMFGGVVMAEENADPGYHPVDAYVINFSGADLEELLKDYEATMPLLFASGHYGSLMYTNGKTSVAAAEVMNLINTSKLTSTPEEERVGAYASLPAYCADAFVKAAGKEGHDYIRMNLEDASYFAEGAAGRVRAMYLNSFPCIKDINVMQDAVNAWLRAQDPNATLLTDLTAAEASSATQMAIWTTIHETSDQMKVVLNSIYDETVIIPLEELSTYVSYPSGEYYGVDCQEEGKTTTAYNMEKVYAYMKDLAPVAPASVVVSEASFVNKEITVARNTTTDSEEVYSVCVKAVVDVVMQQGDSMILSAKLGDEIQNIALANGKNEYTFVFDQLAAPADVVLEINGTQTATDVFFFSPRNGRSASQSMVAADSSQLPVHAETTVKVDRIINFYKTTTIEKDGVGTTYPLEGIEFEIYYAGTVDEYTQWIKDNDREVVTVTEDGNGKKVVAVDEDYAVAVKAKGVLTTVKTDASGKALYNITEAKQPDGIYMIVEKAHSAIVAPLPAFLVAVPATTNDGSGLTYTINLQPKNEVLPGPEVEKNVTQIGTDVDSFDLGETHTWILRGGVPVDIANGKHYVMTDVLDYRLNYQGNVKVVVGTSNLLAGEETITLTAGVDYTLTNGTATDDAGNTVDIFAVELTADGMTKVAEATAANTVDANADNKADYKDMEIRVYFDSVITQDAVVGTEIPNEVTLDYLNSVGIDFEDKDDAKVYTCGINIKKYDAKETTTFLAGAEFMVARKATDAEIADEKIETESLVIAKGQSEVVVFVDFYNNADLTGNKVDKIVTNETGDAIVYGLEEGTYYLVETKAPAGYNLLSYPVSITLNKVSHAAENTVKVANSNSFVLPGTGGIGTTIFTLVGAALSLGSGAVLVGKKRKEEE